MSTSNEDTTAVESLARAIRTAWWREYYPNQDEQPADTIWDEGSETQREEYRRIATEILERVGLSFTPPAPPPP